MTPGPERRPTGPLAFTDVDSEHLTESIGHDAIEDPAGAPAEVDEQAAHAEESSQRPATIGQLRRDRRRLWDERQEAVYHLGGLALDLHGRDSLGDPLMQRRAAVVSDMDRRLVELDAQLAEADDRRRRGRVRAPDPVGYCMSCGAPHLSDAVFCSRCGARIHIPEAESDTQVIAIPEHGGQ